ncbi:class I SAM-dependent methyltransferase [Pseudoalteromonas denitrificans]|uniref:Methyltransferase domain-containing protein n=1 Tax=Pseudoalteromonas denitrificans DSM 6059 TaxID=1123010 RepID=A0A1I1H7F6_9GAMM|nr:class I SAM-dependent methyltransferase [Pseudoalteromonas denitrificans]SFC17363.1 Methyltransferase domain-containing protein [Pseudoalteromonas denitrificans DSM 6059]
MMSIEENKNDLMPSAWSDKLTEDYVEQWGELLLHKRIPEFCNLLPSEIVLDIGCGSGAAVRAIASNLSTGHVTGIDPTSKMLEIAEELTAKESNFQLTTFLLAGAEKIPVESESCDLVLAVNTLHHWMNVDQGMNEVLRILKPSGRFVSIDDLWEESIEYGHEQIEHNESSSCKDDLKTRNVIVKLLNNSGFSNITNNEHRQPDATASIITGYKI